MSTVQHDVAAAAAALAPQILAAREEMDSERRLPTPLVQSLAHAGLFQLNLPRSMGGPENEPLVTFRAVEQLSRVDGSVGWCSVIASGVSLLAGWLQRDVVRELFGQPPDMRVAG